MNAIRKLRDCLSTFHRQEHLIRLLMGFTHRVVIDNDGWWTDIKTWTPASMNDVALNPVVLN